LRRPDPIEQAVAMRSAHPVRTACLAALALLGPLAGTGCATIDGTRQVINRADLVNDLANRLDRGSTLTYSARYQPASGKTATIAQAQGPTRSAYTYPGGKVVISTTEMAECTGQGAAARCTLSPPPLSTSGPPAGVLDAATAQGLVHPTVVMGLLTTASLDTDAVIKQSDTTIAGQHATCVDVSQVESNPAFTACITADGVLGSFAGTLRGNQIEVSLVDYTETVPDTAFDLPAGAKITDQRHR
jgi:hypothetical protein